MPGPRAYAPGVDGDGPGGTLIRAGTLVAGDGRVPVGPGWLALRDGRIEQVGAGPAPRPADTDLPDAVLVPGFVDLHVHGGGGAAFTAGDPEQARRALAFHRAHGTTTSLASLVTATAVDLRRALDALAGLVAEEELAGVHLEGPWLAPGRCGAHDPALLRDPDPAELDALLGTGLVRMVTLAPERPGGLDAVRRVAGTGALAAVGHTDAGHAVTVRAIEAGARVGTHLFNAMPPLHHRDPGPVAALLADPRVTVELVTDGVHVHPSLWELVHRAAPGRVAAVTDATAAAGLGDGDFRLGGLGVAVREGVARLAGTDTVAGSTATSDRLFRAVVAHTPGSRAGALARAVALTASTPARTLGLPDVGVLRPGARADLVVLDGDLRVRSVRRRGAPVPPAR